MTTLEGNELRRAVAEALGHKMRKYKPDMFTQEGWYITFNDRRGTSWVCLPTKTEEQAWGYVFIDEWLPDYATDLNTIKHAPMPDNMVIDVRFQMPTATFPKWGVFIYLYGNTAADYREYLSGHPEPATAFWNAWLMMRKAARDG